MGIQFFQLFPLFQNKSLKREKQIESPWQYACNQFHRLSSYYYQTCLHYKPLHVLVASSPDSCESMVSSQHVQVYLVHSLIFTPIKKETQEVKSLPPGEHSLSGWLTSSSHPGIASANTLSRLGVWKNMVRAFFGFPEIVFKQKTALPFGMRHPSHQSHQNKKGQVLQEHWIHFFNI